jgi:hypothetical protein
MTAHYLLSVRTVPRKDPVDLLGELAGARPLAWVRRNEGLVGWGETAVIPVPAGPGQLTAAERLLGALFDAAETEDHVGLPGCGPVAFGSFAFDEARGGSVLVVPAVVLGGGAGLAWWSFPWQPPPVKWVSVMVCPRHRLPETPGLACITRVAHTPELVQKHRYLLAFQWNHYPA